MAQTSPFSRNGYLASCGPRNLALTIVSLSLTSGVYSHFTVSRVYVHRDPGYGAGIAHTIREGDMTMKGYLAGFNK